MNADAALSKKLSYIQKQFFCGTPLPKFNFKDIFEVLTWENQAELIKITLHHSQILNYPLKVTYQRAFIKYIISKLEECGKEIHDVVYETYGSSFLNDNGNVVYKHYFIDENPDNVITLEENTSFISQGTTGLCSWQASIALSEWCLLNVEVLRQKNILELGSGVGLLGLTVALKCAPAEIWLSDCHAAVLNVLCKNIRLNNKQVQTSGEKVVTNIDSGSVLLRETLSGNVNVGVVSLLWENIADSDFFEQLNPNLIFAADVVYDTSVFDALLGVLTYFLQRNDQCEIILACTVRNQKTLQSFLELAEIHMQIDSLVTPTPNIFYWETDECQIKIYNLRSKFFQVPEISASRT